MVTQRFWIVRGNSRLVLAEDPPGTTPGEQQAGDGAEGAQSGEPAQGTASNDPIPGPIRSFVTDQVKRAITGSFRSFAEEMRGMMRTGGADPNANGNGGEAQASQEGKAPPQNGSGEPLETSTETRLRRLESEMTAASHREKELKDQLSRTQQERDIDSRNTHIQKLASDSGAVNPDEVLAIVGPLMRKDDQRGWLFEVDGEYGKEFKSPEEFIPQFLEQRSHLKKSTQRGGSGAGGGTNTGGPGGQPGFVKGQALTRERLADASFYAENREEIHRQLQSRAQRERVAHLAEYGLRDSPNMYNR